MNKRERRGSIQALQAVKDSAGENALSDDIEIYYNTNEYGENDLDDGNILDSDEDTSYISNNMVRDTNANDIEADIDIGNFNQTNIMIDKESLVLIESNVDDDNYDDIDNISSELENTSKYVYIPQNSDTRIIDNDNNELEISLSESESSLINMKSKEEVELKELALVLALAEEEENSELAKFHIELTKAKRDKDYKRASIFQDAIIEAEKSREKIINDINSENNIEEVIDSNININENLTSPRSPSLSSLFDNSVDENNEMGNISSPDLSFKSRKKSFSSPEFVELKSKYEITTEIKNTGYTPTPNNFRRNTSLISTPSVSSSVLNIPVPTDVNHKFNKDLINNEIISKFNLNNKDIPKIEIDLSMNYTEQNKKVIEIDLQRDYSANNNDNNHSEFDLIYDRNIANEGDTELYIFPKSPAKSQQFCRNRSISPTSPSRYRSNSPTTKLNRSKCVKPNKFPLRSSSPNNKSRSISPIPNHTTGLFNGTNNNKSNQSFNVGESIKPPFVIPKHQSPKPKFIDFNNEKYLIWLEQQQRNIGSTIIERKLRKDVLTTFLNCDNSHNQILPRDEFDNFIIGMGILPSPNDGIISSSDNIFQKIFVFASVISVKYDSCYNDYNTNELMTIDNNDIQELFASGVNILGAIEFTEIIYGIGSGSQKENMDVLHKDSKELISQVKLWKIRTPIMKTASKVEENKVNISNNFVLPPNSKIKPVVPNQNLEATIANRKTLLNERIGNLFKKTHPFKPPSQIPREGDIVQLIMNKEYSVDKDSEENIDVTVISVLKDGKNMNVRCNLNGKILTKTPISFISKWIQRANHYQNKAFSNFKKVEKDNRTSEEKKLENCTFQPKLYGPSPFVSERTMREREENTIENTRWRKLPNNNSKDEKYQDFKSSKKSFRKTNTDILNAGILINNCNDKIGKKKKKRRKTIVGKLCGYYIPGVGLMRGPPTNAGVPLYMMDPISPPSFDDGYYIVTNSSANTSVSSSNSKSSAPIVASKGNPFAPPFPSWAWLTGGDPKSNAVKPPVKLVITKKVKKEEEAPKATGWGAVLEEMNRKKEAKNGGGGGGLKKVVKEVIAQVKVGSLKHTKGSKKPVFTDIMDELAWKLASLRGDFDDKEEVKKEVDLVKEEKVIDVVKDEVDLKSIDDDISPKSEVKTSDDSKDEISHQIINETSVPIEIDKKGIVINVESNEKKVVEVVEKDLEVSKKVVVIAEPEVVKKPAFSLANLFNKQPESIPKVSEIVHPIAVPQAAKMPAPPPLPINLSSPPYIGSNIDSTTNNNYSKSDSSIATNTNTFQSITTTISTSPCDKANLLPGYYLAHPKPGSIGSGEILIAGVTTLELCKVIKDELSKYDDKESDVDDDDDDEDDQDMINEFTSPSKSPGSSPVTKSPIPHRSNSITANNIFMLMVDESKQHKIHLKEENHKKLKQDNKRLEKLKITEIQRQERLKEEEEYKQSLIKDTSFFSANIFNSGNKDKEKVFNYPKALPKRPKVEPENYDYRKDLYAEGEIVISDLPLPPNFHDSIKRMKLGTEMRQKKKDLTFNDSLRSYNISHSPHQLSSGQKDTRPATTPIEFISHVDKRNALKITSRKLVGQAGLYVEETPVIPTSLLKTQPTKENMHVKHLKTTPSISRNNMIDVSIKSNPSPEKNNGRFEIHRLKIGPIDHHPQQKRPPSFKSSPSNLVAPQSPALITGIASSNRNARAVEKKYKEELALKDQKNQNTARKERLRLLANKTAKSVGAYVPQSNRKNCHEKLIEKYSKKEDLNKLSISSMNNVKKDYYNLMGASSNQSNVMYNSNLNSLNKNNFHSPQSDYLNYPNNQNTPIYMDNYNPHERLSIEEFQFFSDGPKEYNF
jgi:hypothetical protein